MPGGESFYVNELPQLKLGREKFSIQERLPHKKRQRKKAKEEITIENQQDIDMNDDEKTIDITI